MPHTHTKARKENKPQVTEQQKRDNFEKYWVRPLQDLILEEQAEDEIIDIQCQTLAKTVTATTRKKKQVLKSCKKWDSGIKKELDALRSRDVFEELTTEEAYHTYWKHHKKYEELAITSCVYPEA